MDDAAIIRQAIDGTALLLADAARAVPGRPVTAGTIRAWVRDRLAGPDGRPVRLKAVRYRGRMYTTPAALTEFLGRVAMPVHHAEASR